MTAAHCVTVVDGGKVCYCDRLRVRIPIQSRWSSVPSQDFDKSNLSELFEDIIVPIVENVTIFTYGKYFEDVTTHRGTDIALIRIPTIRRPQRLPFRLLSGTDIKSATVVGFPVTVTNFSSLKYS